MNDNPKKNENPRNLMQKIARSPLIYVAVVLVIFVLAGILASPGRTVVKEIGYSEFLNLLDEGKIKSVEIDGYTITATPVDSEDLNAPSRYVTRMISNSSLAATLREANVEFKEVEPSDSVSFFQILLMYLPTILFVGLIVYYFIAMHKMRKSMSGEGGSAGEGLGGPFSFMKSSAKQFDMKNCTTRFQDVAGQDEAKESLMEIVDILKNPSKYTSIGAQVPKGALLVGPPGTGKTLLAKAVAGEAGCPFFFVSGSQFVEMFVGAGAARVRDLFKQAAQKAPCIIFIDEIDAVGKKRDSSGIANNDEQEQTLNQLLAEMDGFEPGKGIMVLGATNRPEILDKALLRPGRFDRRIPVELPDMNGRLEILNVHAKKKVFEPNVDLKRVADATPGASGAELANILNEAALAAVRAHRTRISQADLDHATEYVIAGSEKKSMVISQDEKQIIAYHEIGHALVAAKQKNGVPIRKITIIPRTSGALGFTMQAEEQERVLMKREDLINELQVLTAGRAAEELIFGTCTSGASNDIEKATAIARNMIARFGMNDEIGMMALDTVVNPYLGGELRTNCSPESAAKVEREMHRLITEAYETAKQILRDNAASLNRLSQYLLENENISGDEFMELLKQGELADSASNETTPESSETTQE